MSEYQFGLVSSVDFGIAGLLREALNSHRDRTAHPVPRMKYWACSVYMAVGMIHGASAGRYVYGLMF